MVHKDNTYQSDDGLQIHYYSYGQKQKNKPTLLCLPGLTLNGKSFENYATHCHQKFNVHILAPAMRGRGQSDYDPNPDNYNLMREAQDIMGLIAHEALENIIIFGTSRGGMQSAMLAPMLQNRLKGVILNDIGALIPMAVMENLKKLFAVETDKIGDYKAALDAFYIRDNGMTLNLTTHQEREIIDALYRKEDGIYYLDYDYKAMAIAFAKAHDALMQLDPNMCDLRPLFNNFKDVPLMLLHGENSRLLTSEIIKETQKILPHLNAHTIKDRGHCPYLHEPEVVALCDDFIEKLF